MDGIGFKKDIEEQKPSGEGFCGRPKEEGFRDHGCDHRNCGYNDGFTGIYELAVKHGFDGTEHDFLLSLYGNDGKSAYESAVEGGFVGTEEEFNIFLAMRTDYASWVGTVDEYNALSDEEKMRDKVIHYIIEEV